MRTVHGLGVIVKAHLYAVFVRKIQKPFHIGKQLRVDIVTPAVRAIAPVGIDHHDVQGNVVIFVI